MAANNHSSLPYTEHSMTTTQLVAEWHMYRLATTQLMATVILVKTVNELVQTVGD
jgi:hypothetical protein